MSEHYDELHAEIENLREINAELVTALREFIQTASNTDAKLADTWLNGKMAELDRLRDELRVTNELLDERNRLLAIIPECPDHGACVPHAIEWVESTKNLSAINAELEIAIKGALAALSQPATFPADIEAAKSFLQSALTKAGAS